MIMKLLSLPSIVKAALMSALVLATASASALPILRWETALQQSPDAQIVLFDSGASLARGGQVSISAADEMLFSHMGRNGGHHQIVAFRGEDDSVMIGYYATGPWAKTQLLRYWQETPVLPIVETVSGLPEPSTVALLALSLFAVLILRRRHTTR
jgi:PEP-CTERM motif